MKSVTPSLLAAACAILLLIPVWSAPVLATADGPSHLYNVVVSVDLMQGGPTYGAWLEHGTYIAPNRAASTILAWLTPALGPSRAEALLFSFMLLGTFLLLVAVATRHVRAPAAGILICAWLSQHWFAWTGFYDFSLSVLAFAVLLLILQHTRGLRRAMLVQILALFLAWSHVFTFAIGAAVIAWVLLLRALRERRPFALLPALPPACLLIWVLASGGTGGSGFGWGNRLKAFAGLVIGDVVTTFHPVDLVAGIVIMVTFWIALLSVLRRACRTRDTQAAALPLVAAALMLLSLVGPDAVGDGSYISARLRFLAVLVLLPIMGTRLDQFAPPTRRSLGALLFGALLIHAGLASVQARAVARDTTEIDTLAAAAGARAGDAIQMTLFDQERGAFRISTHAHLHARVAIRRRLVLLDNYEARLDVFPIQWRQEPEALLVNRRVGALGLRRRAGAPWQRPVHLVHDADVRIDADSSLAVHGTVRGREFAVTTVSFEPRP